MPGFLYERVIRQLHTPGIIIVPWGMADGPGAADLAVLLGCSDAWEIENRVRWLPLRE